MKTKSTPLHLFSGKCIRFLVPAFLLLLNAGSKATAQILNLYSFTQSAGTYTPISGGTVVVANTVASPSGNDSAAMDDFTYAPVSIPFTFNYNGSPYTSFQVNSNGWILFGGGFTGSTSGPISGTGGYAGAIAGYAADLMGAQQSSGDVTSGSDTIQNIGNTSFCTVGASIIGTGIPAGATIVGFTANSIKISAPATSTGTGRTINWTAGEIRVENIGTAPNRVCVIQFKNVAMYATSGNGMNFQIRLSEGGGSPANQTIQVVYGTWFTGSSSTGQVGLRGATNAEFNNRTSTTSWSASTAGTGNGATMTFSGTVKPASGQTYTWNPPPNCSGKPVAGTIIPVQACPGQNFRLSSTGPAVTLGLTYQWQDSTIGGWQNSVGASATTRFLTANITTPTKFRLIVTCSISGQADTTVPYLVTMAPFYECYCVPTYTNGGTTDNITNVQLKNMVNNTSGAGNVSPYYTNYSSQQPTPIAIPNLTMGERDTVRVTFNTDGSQYSGIWIDFNHSGTFETSEFFTQNTNAGGGGTAVISFLTPLTAQAGLTKLRIRGGDDSQPSATQPCGPSNSTYGEGEDYLVNILYPPCNGPLSAGSAEASETALCVGYTFDVLDTTHEYSRSRMTTIWQNSFDGGLSWNDVPNSTNKDTLNNVLFTGTVSYRLKMICDVTGDSTFSTPAQVVIKEPYQCYCYSQSNGGSTDVSDIGGTVINTMVTTTGGPHVLNPTAIRRRTDYTDIPPIVLNADGSYRLSVYHIQKDAVHHDARVTVFIDFNNDLHYDVSAQPNSERVYSGITRANNFYLDTMIHIPNAVIPNVPTGMRIILNEDTDPNAPANMGCGPYVSGETEDYVVMFRRVPSNVPGVSNITSLSLYPNPTTDGRFTVNARGEKALEQATLHVTTITGQVVLQKSYANVGNTFTEQLDLADVARGIYFVELRVASGEKTVRKLIVK